MTNKLSFGASQAGEAIMRKLGTFCQVIYCSRGIIAHHYTSNIASQMIYRQVRMHHKAEITSGRRLTEAPNPTDGGTVACINIHFSRTVLHTTRLVMLQYCDKVLTTYF